jgi:hypothetical protein
LSNWFTKCKAQIPNYEDVNGGPAQRFGGWFKSVLESKKQ